MKFVALVGAACMALLSVPAPAAAQRGPSPDPTPLLMPDGTLIAHLLVPSASMPAFQPARRPQILGVLYASFIGLEVYDGYSTSTGLTAGATESNGLVRWAAVHPTIFWGVKGGAAAASLYVAERMWRRHRRGQAIAVMVASNVVMAAVAANNWSVLHSQR